MTEEHFDEAFDFAASLAEQRRRRDEEERRSDPIYGLPGESPDEWYARRLQEVRDGHFAFLRVMAPPQENFHNLDVAENIKPLSPEPRPGRLQPGRMVPRFDERPATGEELSQIARDWPPPTSRVNRELEALRRLEAAIINGPMWLGDLFRDELNAIKKARQP